MKISRPSSSTKTPLQVFPSDKMPTTICEYCISIMDFLYRFKQMCREADGALRVVHSSEIWPMALDIPQFPEDAPFAIVEKLEIPVDDPGQVVEILESDLFIEDSQPVSTLEELEIKNKDESSITISLPMEVLKKPTMSPLKRLKSHIKSKATGVPSSSLSAPKETRVLSRIKNEPKVLNQIPSKGQTTKVPQFMRNKNGNVEILMEEKPDLLQTDVFPCPHCDRSFPLQQLLEIHEQNHTRERESACEVCDKKFFTKYDLAKVRELNLTQFLDNKRDFHFSTWRCTHKNVPMFVWSARNPSVDLRCCIATKRHI